MQSQMMGSNIQSAEGSPATQSVDSAIKIADECMICLEALDGSRAEARLTCGHVFCLGCTATTINMSGCGVVRCSLCRSEEQLPTWLPGPDEDEDDTDYSDDEDEEDDDDDLSETLHLPTDHGTGLLLGFTGFGDYEENRSDEVTSEESDEENEDDEDREMADDSAWSLREFNTEQQTSNISEGTNGNGESRAVSFLPFVPGTTSTLMPTLFSFLESKNPHADDQYGDNPEEVFEETTGVDASSYELDLMDDNREGNMESNFSESAIEDSQFPPFSSDYTESRHRNDNRASPFIPSRYLGNIHEAQFRRRQSDMYSYETELVQPRAPQHNSSDLSLELRYINGMDRIREHMRDIEFCFSRLRAATSSLQTANAIFDFGCDCTSPSSDIQTGEAAQNSQLAGQGNKYQSLGLQRNIFLFSSKNSTGESPENQDDSDPSNCLGVSEAEVRAELSINNRLFTSGHRNVCTSRQENARDCSRSVHRMFQIGPLSHALPRSVDRALEDLDTLEGREYQERQLPTETPHFESSLLRTESSLACRQREGCQGPDLRCPDCARIRGPRAQQTFDNASVLIHHVEASH